MFSFGIPRFWQISSNLSFRSWRTSGFRAVGRLTVMAVTLCWSWGPLGQGGHMMGTDGTDWCLGRSEGGSVAWVDFDIFRISFCTERDFLTFPSPSLGYPWWAPLFGGGQVTQEKFGMIFLSAAHSTVNISMRILYHSSLSHRFFSHYQNSCYEK